LSKVHFNYESECRETYDWLIDAASRTGDESLVDEAKQTKTFFLGV